MVCFVVIAVEGVEEGLHSEVYCLFLVVPATRFARVSVHLDCFSLLVHLTDTFLSITSRLHLLLVAVVEHSFYSKRNKKEIFFGSDLKTESRYFYD